MHLAQIDRLLKTKAAQEKEIEQLRKKAQGRGTAYVPSQVRCHQGSAMYDIQMSEGAITGVTVSPTGGCVARSARAALAREGPRTAGSNRGSSINQNATRCVSFKHRGSIFYPTTLEVHAALHQQ